MTSRNRIRDHLPAANGAAAPDTTRRPAPAPGLLPLLLDLKAAAAFLGGVAEVTVKRMARDGTFPPGVVLKLGRRRLFSRVALEKWVADGCPRPRGRAGA
jgi:hypothetical protein